MENKSHVPSHQPGYITLKSISNNCGSGTTIEGYISYIYSIYFYIPLNPLVSSPISMGCTGSVLLVVLGDLFHGHSRRPGIGHRCRGGSRLQVLKAEGEGKGGKNGEKQVKSLGKPGEMLENRGNLCGFNCRRWRISPKIEIKPY
jgi:hypothetical protein